MSRLSHVLPVLSMLFAVPAIALAAYSHSAYAKCQPGRADDGIRRTDGWLNNPGVTIGGVYSNILNYSPWVQPNSEVVAWTMLARADGSAWAQVGWWEQAYGTRYTFVQWTGNGSVYTKFWGPQPTGQSTYYTTLYNGTSRIFTFQVAGATIDSESAQFAPNSAQIFGETLSLADQMPGGAYSGEVFADSHMYTFGWGDFGIGAVDYRDNGNTYYGISDVSQLQRNIWDWSCPF